MLVSAVVPQFRLGWFPASTTGAGADVGNTASSETPPSPISALESRIGNVVNALCGLPMHNEVKNVKLSFSGLAAPDLDGRSRTEVFVNVEADLTVLDGGREVLRAGAFPVVELASALCAWKALPSDDRGDFTFTSLSLEGHWRLRLLRSTDGWHVVDDGDPDAFAGAPHSAVFTGAPALPLRSTPRSTNSLPVCGATAYGCSAHGSSPTSTKTPIAGSGARSPVVQCLNQRASHGASSFSSASSDSAAAPPWNSCHRDASRAAW